MDALFIVSDYPYLILPSSVTLRVQEIISQVNYPEGENEEN